MELWVDGGCLGRNPSSLGVYWSVAIRHADGTTTRVIEREESAAHSTNNQAEALAILAALHVAADEPSTIWSDSQLLVEQSMGRWRCNEPTLRVLVADIQQRLRARALAGAPVTLQWHARSHSVAALGH